MSGPWGRSQRIHAGTAGGGARPALTGVSGLSQRIYTSETGGPRPALTGVSGLSQRIRAPGGGCFDRTVWGGPALWAEEWTTLASAGYLVSVDHTYYETDEEHIVCGYLGGLYTPSEWFPYEDWDGNDASLAHMVAAESFTGTVDASGVYLVNGGAPFYVPAGETTFRLYMNGEVVASGVSNGTGAYAGAEWSGFYGGLPLSFPGYVLSYTGEVAEGDSFWMTLQSEVDFTMQPDWPASGAVFVATKVEVV